MPSRSSLGRDVFRHVEAYVPPLALGRDVFRHVPAYVPLLVRDRDVFRHVPAYDPLLALGRDVFRHVPAYDPLLALGRDVFRHVPAYVAPPLLQTPQGCRASFGPPSLRSLRSAASLAPDQCSQFPWATLFERCERVRRPVPIARGTSSDTTRHAHSCPPSGASP